MMDMRPGQGPLMPTLAPPLGLGLPPGHLGLPHPHPFQTPGEYNCIVCRYNLLYPIFYGWQQQMNAKFSISAKQILVAACRLGSSCDKSIIETKHTSGTSRVIQAILSIVLECHEKWE